MDYSASVNIKSTGFGGWGPVWAKSVLILLWHAPLGVHSAKRLQSG